MPVAKQLRRHQEQISVANPTAQTADRTAGTQFANELAGATGAVARGVDTEKGWLACSITYAKTGGVTAGAAWRPQWFPTFTSREKGMRNFTEAASQSQ